MTIERRQLTAYLRARLPREMWGKEEEYFEYEKISTGLSSAICMFGYQEVTPSISGSYKIRPWIKLSELRN